MSGLMGLMQPGPTLYEANNLRKQRGSQGLLGAIGEPLSYAPGPLGMVGSGLLGAQYLTGEKPIDEGLSGMAMLTALLQGTKVAPIVRPIFAGTKALTADKEKLKTAKELDSAGADRQFIWDKTGWFKGADRQWRFEIPDNAARFNSPEISDKGWVAKIESGPLTKTEADRLKYENPKLSVWNRAVDDYRVSGNAATPDFVQLEVALSHPEYRRAYSRTLDPIVSIDTLGSGGSYSPDVGGRITLPGVGQNSGKSVLLHELQHAIQQREGFARGGSPEQFIKPDQSNFDLLKSLRSDPEIQQMYMNAEKALNSGDQTGALAWSQKADDQIKFLAYKRLAGEVEARNVQSRMNMTPAERKLLPPWSTEDVPANMQIIRGLLGM